jgi:hypothetical protein
LESIVGSAVEAAVRRDVGDEMRVDADVDISVEIIDPSSKAPPAASAAKRLEAGDGVAELEADEQAIVLQFVDSEGITTDEVTGDRLLEWWMSS